MMVTEREAGDLQRLHDLADQERDALRRDRYRAVRLALEGKEAFDIADRIDRSRRSVQDWVYAYRDGGIDAIQPKPRPGLNDNATQAKNVVVGAFNGMEDALVQFVETGKINFKGLVDSILGDLTKLLLNQALQGLLNSFSGGFGGLISAGAGAAAGGGARASGGPVSPNTAYIVGENGPEIFSPGSGGQIIPNNQIGGSQPDVHVHVVNVSDSKELSSFLNSPEGANIIVNQLQRNNKAAKQALS